MNNKSNFWLGLFFLLTCQTAFAQLDSDQQSASPVVRKIKGQKAIVDLPANSDLKEGDTLFVSKASSSNSKRGKFLKRDYRSQFLMAYATNEDSEAKIKTTSLGVSLIYGLNWGMLESGLAFDYYSVNLTSTSSVSGESEGSMSEVGLFLQFNIIPNTPGTELVPFLRGTYQLSSQKSKLTTSSTSTTVDYSGNATGIGLGLDYYPSGLNFGVSALYTMKTRTLKDKDKNPYSDANGSILNAGLVWML